MAFDFDAQLATWKKNLLDTTKRNRLIKFSSGRSGGVEFLHPPAHELWRNLVVEEKPYLFPWKRDLLGLDAEEVDREPPLSEPIDPGTTNLHPEPVEATVGDSAKMLDERASFPASRVDPNPEISLANGVPGTGASENSDQQGSVPLPDQRTAPLL